MRRLLITPLLALGMLASCATPITTTTVIPGTSISIQSVQDFAKFFCGWVPTAASVLAVATANNALVLTATGIAQAMCAVAVPASAARRASGVAFIYVPPGSVHGTFVTK